MSNSRLLVAGLALLAVTGIAVFSHVRSSGGPPAAPDNGAATVADAGNAPTGGMLQCDRMVGDRVKRGENLATIYDLNLERIAQVASPAAGVIGVLRLAASVQPGQLVASVFK